MANIEDCPGFETFGADVKAARSAKHLSRKTLAEIVNIDSRYLANIENEGAIPSLPVIIQLIKVCGLPVEQYMEKFSIARVRMERTKYNAVQSHAEARGESVNGFINRAIDETMDRDKAAPVGPEGGEKPQA